MLFSETTHISLSIGFAVVLFVGLVRFATSNIFERLTARFPDSVASVVTVSLYGLAVVAVVTQFTGHNHVYIVQGGQHEAFRLYGSRLHYGLPDSSHIDVVVSANNARCIVINASENDIQLKEVGYTTSPLIASNRDSAVSIPPHSFLIPQLGEIDFFGTDAPPYKVSITTQKGRHFSQTTKSWLQY